MKGLLCNCIFLLVCLTCQGQSVSDSVHPLFRGELDGDKIRESYDNYEIPRRSKETKGPYNEIILSVFHSRNLYVYTALNVNEKLKELDDFGFKLDSSRVYSTRNDYVRTTAVPLFDSMGIIVTAYGINSQNRSLYQFRVLLNKTTPLVPWSAIRTFCPIYTYYRYNADGSEQTEMAYLGEFKAPLGSSLTIEVRNIKTPDKVSSVSAMWIKRPPAVISTFTASKMNEFMSVYKYQWKHDFNKPNTSTYYGDIELKPVDSLIHLQKEFGSSENSIFFYLKDKVKFARFVEYNLVSGTDSSGWTPGSFDPNVIWLKELKPGNYRLLLRYSFQRQNISEYAFHIKTAWYQTIWLKALVAILFILAFSSLLLVLKNRRQAQKLRSQLIQQQMVQSELKSIRSQFNPHFVFNSLSSIQGLITKYDMEGANKYLTDFSTLLRNSLRESQRDFTSLSKEIDMLDNYLKLEQLRFEFSYEIIVAPDINKESIEVPVLLLQPVIENAVKHGISGMYEKGVLALAFKSSGPDLIASVTDNGKGFDVGGITGGFGLTLTKDRVVLLNKTMKGQEIRLDINSNGTGTRVTFTFKNWLV